MKILAFHSLLRCNWRHSSRTVVLLLMCELYATEKPECQRGKKISFLHCSTYINAQKSVTVIRLFNCTCKWEVKPKLVRIISFNHVFESPVTNDPNHTINALLLYLLRANILVMY